MSRPQKIRWAKAAANRPSHCWMRTPDDRSKWVTTCGAYGVALGDDALQDSTDRKCQNCVRALAR